MNMWYYFVAAYFLCSSFLATADWIEIKYRYPSDVIYAEKLFVNENEVRIRQPNCNTYDTQDTCLVQTDPSLLRWGSNYFDLTVQTDVRTESAASAISIGVTAYKEGTIVEFCRQGNIIPNSGLYFRDFEWQGDRFDLVCKAFRDIESQEQRELRIRIAREALANAVAELDAATILESFSERIKNMSFDELQRIAIDADFPGELKGLLEWLKRIGLDIDTKRQAFQDSKTKIQSEIDELAEKLEDITESEGIPKDAIALPEQIESLLPDEEEQQQSRLGLLANEIVNQFIENVTTSWQAGDRIKILNLASDFLEQISSLQEQISARSLAEPLEAQVVQSAIFRGTQFLYDKGCAGSGCLSRDLWFKDTPVPEATRRVLKESIRPTFGDSGIQIEKGMRAWVGQLNPTQQYALSLVEAMGPAAMALAGETDTLARAAYRGLQATAAELAVAVRDLSLTGAALTPGLSDANDLCEVTTGREFCGSTGRILSSSERALSAAGFLIGTGQAWRAVGSKLKSFFMGAQTHSVVDAGMKILDSAKSIGFKTGNEIKSNVGVIERWSSKFKTTKIDEAASINSGYPEPPYLSGTKVVEFETTGTEIFHRVHQEGNKARSWMLRKSDIEGLSPIQIKEKFNLPEVPTQISEVHVPAGTSVRTGTIGPNAFGSSKGATQYELRQQLDETLFKNTQNL